MRYQSALAITYAAMAVLVGATPQDTSIKMVTASEGVETATLPAGSEVTSDVGSGSGSNNAAAVSEAAASGSAGTAVAGATGSSKVATGSSAASTGSSDTGSAGAGSGSLAGPSGDSGSTDTTGSSGSSGGSGSPPSFGGSDIPWGEWDGSGDKKEWAQQWRAKQSGGKQGPSGSAPAATGMPPTASGKARRAFSHAHERPHARSFAGQQGNPFEQGGNQAKPGEDPVGKDGKPQLSPGPHARSFDFSQGSTGNRGDNGMEGGDGKSYLSPQSHARDIVASGPSWSNVLSDHISSSMQKRHMSYSGSNADQWDQTEGRHGHSRRDLPDGQVASGPAWSQLTSSG